MEKEEILAQVKQYYQENHVKKPYQSGDRINYAGRVYDEEEMCNLVDSALDFWLTAGSYTKQFEQDFATYLGVPFVSLVNSGSSANLLAIAALKSPLLKERRMQAGDEIITVAAAFPTTVAPIVQNGFVPVFVDIEIPSYNLDAQYLEAAKSNKTKALLLAQSLGNPIPLEPVKRFCEKYNLWLIEDNCDSLGAEYLLDGVMKKTGIIGDIGTSSFYPAHHMTMGEGGAVYTANPLLNRIVRSLRDWGRDCICGGGEDNRCGHRFDGQFGTLPQGYDHKYVYSQLGYNLKVTDMQSAIGCAQLKKLPNFVEARRDNWEYLRKHLEDLEDVLVLPEKQKNSNPSWFGFMLLVRDDAEVNRDDIVAFLEENQIQTRALFAGNILRHPCMLDLTEDVDYRVASTLEETDRCMMQGFWIGVYPGMETTMLDEMIAKIHQACRR